MAYSSAHILLRVNGHFGTSTAVTDGWSFGMRFGVAGADVAYDEAKLQTFVQSAYDAAFTFVSDPLTLAGTACWMDNCSAARVGQNGKYSPTTQTTKFSTGPAVAGTGTVTLPWNSAQVVSLRTANPRGYASNGRVYVPLLAGTIVAATGRLTGTVTSNRLNNFKTMVTKLNTAANLYDPGARLRVMSNIGLGTSAHVTSMRSDDRIDSIERRENALPSVWTTVTVP